MRTNADPATQMRLACPCCSTLIGKYQLVYVFSEKYQTGGKVCAVCTGMQ